MINDYTERKERKKPFLYYWPRIQSAKGCRERAGKVLQFINKYHKNARSILELGTGIGGVLARFQKKYSLFGVDIGANFTEYAQKRIPRAEFQVASMHNFSFDKKFDVIFSIFHSANFLQSFGEWNKMMNKAHAHLEDGGLFIVDTMTPRMLKNDKNTYSCRDESFGFVADQKLVKGNALTWRFLFFEKLKGGLFECNEYFFPAKVFDTSRIEKELKKKFIILEKVDYGTLKKATSMSETVIFVCRKKR